MVFRTIATSFDFILEPILRPLLTFGPFFTVVIISILMATLMTFIYKWTTNQKRMKEIREKLKQHQAEIKLHKHNPDKAMAINKEMMETTMEQFKLGMRPMLFTMLPALLIFGWLIANLAFYPILPGENFTAALDFAEGYNGEVEIIIPEGIKSISGKTAPIENKKATFELSGESGAYILRFNYDGHLYTKELLITSEQRYEDPIEQPKDNIVTKIELSNTPLKFDLGFFKIGWLLTYVIVSVIVNIGLKKILKIY